MLQVESFIRATTTTFNMGNQLHVRELIFIECTKFLKTIVLVLNNTEERCLNNLKKNAKQISSFVTKFVNYKYLFKLLQLHKSYAILTV